MPTSTVSSKLYLWVVYVCLRMKMVQSSLLYSSMTKLLVNWYRASIHLILFVNSVDTKLSHLFLVLDYSQYNPTYHQLYMGLVSSLCLAMEFYECLSLFCVYRFRWGHHNVMPAVLTPALYHGLNCTE